MLPEMKGATKWYIKEILDIAVTLAEHRRSKVVKEDDVKLACKIKNRPLYR